MQKRLTKFIRQPDAVSGRRLTARSLAIIAVISRYRLLPTSLLVRLIDGNEDVTHRHLQQLYHKGLINRFAFPKLGSAGEFHYYLDNPAALELLAAHAVASETELDWEGVARNHDKAYHEINDPQKSEEASGRILFLKHEAMISRFHFLLEMAAAKSRPTVDLALWRQGPALNSSVTDQGTGEIMPHRPDAFFTLRFCSEPEGRNRASFFYEADRKTTNVPKMMLKFRAHAEFIRQGRGLERYGLKRIRAVLVETVDTAWAEALRGAASEICPAPLFWFTASPVLAPCLSRASQQQSLPSAILQKLWVSNAGDALLSLMD
ncbi:MAG TPA: replication-relaxation family protein [Candidatus Sulfotelmatobacter sp.]|nr:replication-relaxation family protein [Candidatus Sulfotelmatobacter sp.]